MKDQSLLVSRPNRLCAQARSEDGMPFYNAVREYTPMGVLVAVREANVHHLVLPTRKHGFHLWSFKDTFQTRFDTSDFAHCLWMIRGGETVSDSIFLHDLCKLVIAEMSSAITYDSSRDTKSGEERF
ncbi:hypothetical protein Tco_1185192 [Tanacetum coccineum]